MNSVALLPLRAPVRAAGMSPVVRAFALGTAAFLGVILLSTIMEKAGDATVLNAFAPRLPVVATVTIRENDIPWHTVLANNFLFWGTWALLTPLIVLAARRLIIRSTVLRVALWIVFGILACLAHASISQLGRGVRVEPALSAGQLIIRLAASMELNLVSFGLITGSVHALIYYRDSQLRRQRQAELEARLTRAELDVLRMQLHPHFFFNTLHTVSALMTTDVSGARRVLVSLGELLRNTMEQGGRQEVSLREELALAERYVEIQQARFGPRLSVRFTVPADLLQAVVPSAVLQPLIENAIRHGIEPYPGNGSVAIVTQRSEKQLTIVVRNDVLQSGRDSPIKSTRGSGMGLANIRARLDHLYPGDYSFQQTSAAGSYTVTLTIPWQTND